MGILIDGKWTENDEGGQKLFEVVRYAAGSATSICALTRVAHALRSRTLIALSVR